jgi:hypothetical protein
MRPFGNRWFLQLSFLLLIGCNSSPRATSLVEIVDSSGVTIVHNHYEGFDTLAVRLVEDLRIGVVDGPEEYQFHQIRGITVDALGRIFVSNGGSRSVRVYDREGRWVRDIGRRGSGPGEFERISPPAVWRDSLGVYDPGSRRFALFDTAGQHLASWSMVSANGSTAYPLKGGPAGWTVWITETPDPSASHVEGTITRDTIRLGHVDLRELAEAVESGPAGETALEGAVAWPTIPRNWAQGDRGIVGWIELFAPDRSWALDDAGRIYLSTGYPYRIDIFDETGQHVRRITRAFQERPVTDADVAEYLSRYAAALEPGPYAEDQLRNARQSAATYRAEYFGATGSLLASRNGEIWIERLDVIFAYGNHAFMPGFVRGPRYWDVFDAEGKYEFTIRLPDRFTARWIDHRSVIGVLRDDNGVEHVVRYRLEEAAGRADLGQLGKATTVSHFS